MGDVDVHIWPAKNTSDTKVSHAEDAVNALDSETTYDFDPFSETDEPEFDAGPYDTWSEVLNNFADHVETYYGTPDDNETHLILINDSFDNWGAGKAGGKLFNNDKFENSGGTVAGVNVVVYNYTELTNCMGGEPLKAEKATDIHEVGHTVLSDQTYDFPSESCTGSVGIEHSSGGIYSGDVTSMQCWYTEESCDDNSTPCDNCTGNPDQNVYGIYVGLASCAEDAINSFLDANAP